MKADTFKTITGHKDSLAQLTSLAKSSRLPHALLFSGPDSVGKFTIARALAAALLDTPDLGNKTNPDLHIIHPAEGKKDISVEAARELTSKLQLKPYNSKKVVAIIDNAERLSLAAANSLLKTLEEPTSHSHLILVTSAAHRLPETIISRLQRVFFGELETTELAKIIQQILSKSPNSKALASELASLAKGNLSLLGLEKFRNPQNAVISGDSEGPEEVEAHLESLAGDLSALRKRFLEITKLSDAHALSVAAELGAKDQKALWPVLRSVARDLLASKSGISQKNAAELLEMVLSAEKWVKERNANAQMQLSQVFLKLASVR